MNITQENLANYVRIDNIAVTEEMSLNIDNAIDNIIEPDPAPEQDSDLEDDVVESSNTITAYSEALKIINDLNFFAKKDYTAFEHLKKSQK